MSEPSSGPLEAADPAAEALELLERLNRMCTTEGERLPAVVSVEGFEPWWFLQESVLWELLVPFTENRRWVCELLDGREVAGDETPAAVRQLFRRLGEPLCGGRAGAAAGRSRAALLLKTISRGGLLIVSLVSVLLARLGRRDTLVYILDQVSPGLRHDFRLDGIYRELRRRSYRFAECVHLHGGRELYRVAWRNLVRRRRPVVFLEALSRLSHGRSVEDTTPALPLDTTGSSDPESAFLRRVARHTLGRARLLAAEIPRIQRLLRLMGVRRIIALDDSRHVNGLVAAARLEGIPSLGYMHGLFNRYHPGLLCRGLGSQARRHGFDLLGVWSDYFRNRLLAGELYDHEHSFVSGPIRQAVETATVASPVARRPTDQPLRILLLSEPRARQDEVRSYVRRLLAAEGCRVVLKVRPGEAVPHFRLRGGQEGSHLEVLRSGTVYEAFESCDVVVGTYSSVLYEAALALLPAVLLRTTFSYGHELVEDGLAELAERPEEVVETVERAAALDLRERRRRRDALWGDAPLDGARHLFDVAESRLWVAPGTPTGAGPQR